MTLGSDVPKASPESVAMAIFDAVDNGEDIFPIPPQRSLLPPGAIAPPSCLSASSHKWHPSACKRRDELKSGAAPDRRHM